MKRHPIADVQRDIQNGNRSDAVRKFRALSPDAIADGLAKLHDAGYSVEAFIYDINRALSARR